MSGKCIGYNYFNKLYPIEMEIGKGSYGIVYSSGDNIVKVQPLGGNFWKEICIISQCRHPNIIKIKNITLQDDMGYIAMERGKLLKEYFAEEILKREPILVMREIISDIMSALLFLNSNGIAHSDLKPSNLVVIGNKVKLIDFSISQFADFYDEYRIKDIAYTENYRDPEYFFGELNSIKCELYSLAMTIYFLFEKNHEYGKKRAYYPTCEKYLEVLERKLGKSEETDKLLAFLMELISPISTRKTINELILDEIVLPERIRDGTFYQSAPYKISSIMDRETMLESFEHLESYYSNPRVISLAFDIFCRYKNFSNKEDEVMTLSMIVATCLLKDPTMSDIKTTFPEYTDEELLKLMCDFYTFTEGVWYQRNAWDKYGPSFQEKLLEKFDVKIKFTSKPKELIRHSDKKIIELLSHCQISSVEKSQNIEKHYNQIIYYSLTYTKYLALLTPHESFVFYKVLYNNYNHSKSSTVFERVLYHFDDFSNFSEIHDFVESNKDIWEFISMNPPQYNIFSKKLKNLVAVLKKKQKKLYKVTNKATNETFFVDSRSKINAIEKIIAEKNISPPTDIDYLDWINSFYEKSSSNNYHIAIYED